MIALKNLIACAVLMSPGGRSKFKRLFVFLTNENDMKNSSRKLKKRLKLVGKSWLNLFSLLSSLMSSKIVEAVVISSKTTQKALKMRFKLEFKLLKSFFISENDFV